MDRIKLNHVEYPVPELPPENVPVVRGRLLAAGYSADDIVVSLVVTDYEGDEQQVIIELDRKQADAMQRAIAACLRDDITRN